MAWTTELQNQAADNSSYLGVFDSTASGAPTGGGASYDCNETIMGFIFDLPFSGTPKLIQKTAIALPHNPAGYTQIDTTYPFATTPGSILVAVFTSIFQSALFDVAISDSTSLGWTAAYPTNGHVPGESNTLQGFVAISAGGRPNVMIVRNPALDAMTSPNLILMEYTGLTGVIASKPSAFLVGSSPLVIPNATTSAGDLLLMAISIIPACVDPNVIPQGGGTTPPPPSGLTANVFVN